MLQSSWDLLQVLNNVNGSLFRASKVEGPPKTASHAAHGYVEMLVGVVALRRFVGEALVMITPPSA